MYICGWRKLAERKNKTFRPPQFGVELYSDRKTVIQFYDNDTVEPTIAEAEAETHCGEVRVNTYCNCAIEDDPNPVVVCCYFVDEQLAKFVLILSYRTKRQFVCVRDTFS